MSKQQSSLKKVDHQHDQRIVDALVSNAWLASVGLAPGTNLHRHISDFNGYDYSLEPEPFGEYIVKVSARAALGLATASTIRISDVRNRIYDARQKYEAAKSLYDELNAGVSRLEKSKSGNVDAATVRSYEQAVLGWEDVLPRYKASMESYASDLSKLEEEMKLAESVDTGYVWSQTIDLKEI